jgi:hypothetical protein
MGSKQTTETESVSQIGVAENQAQFQKQIADIDKQLANLQSMPTRLGGDGGKERQRLMAQRAELQKTMQGIVPISQLETMGREAQEKGFADFLRGTELGPGDQDISAALTAQRGFADTLGQFAEGGFLPSEQDFATAQQFTEQAFAPAQQQMAQMFSAQQTQARRLAAQLGRPVNDPVIQAKLAQEQAQQQAMMGAQQTAFGSQFALNLPQQRLGFQGQQASVLGDLANRAQANRQLALSLGSSIQNLERNFRLQAGPQRASQKSTVTSSANALDVIGAGLQIGGAIATGGASLGLTGAMGAKGGGGDGFAEQINQQVMAATQQPFQFQPSQFLQAQQANQIAPIQSNFGSALTGGGSNPSLVR